MRREPTYSVAAEAETKAWHKGKRICANLFGFAAGEMGAGRKTKEDSIDGGAGILVKKKTGDRVKKGESLATLYASEKSLLERGEKAFLSALTFSPEKPMEKPLIYKVIV